MIQYDHNTDTYCQVGVLPSPYDTPAWYQCTLPSSGATHLAALTVGSTIIVSGGVLAGTDQPNQCTNVTNAVVEFTPAPVSSTNGTFRTLANMCSPRHGHGAALLPPTTACAREVVFFAVGFETTAPAVALAAVQALLQKRDNLDRKSVV